MEKSITNPFLLQDETVRPAQMELPEELRKKVVILQCESEEGICKSCVKPRDPRPTVVPRFIDVMVAMWKSNDYNAFATLVSFVMKKYRRLLGCVSVSEFQIGYKEAKKYGGKVILGDRPIEITNQRTWSKMTFWYRTKFVLIVLFMLAALPLASVQILNP
ncbi:hypothetical protein SUGI_0343720 [Cryptomeria japonica]|nr:hypothetical protein SUGI_0343720 [Cryptomeria japonica]